MCSIGFLAAGQGLQLLGSYQQAQEQERLNRAQAALERQAAADTLSFEHSATVNQFSALQAQASRDAIEAKIASTQARSSALVSAAQGGVSGQSVERLLEGYEISELRYSEGLQGDLDTSSRNAGLRLQAAKANQENKNVSAGILASQETSPLGFIGQALELGSTLYDATQQRNRTRTQNRNRAIQQYSSPTRRSY